MQDHAEAGPAEEQMYDAYRLDLEEDDEEEPEEERQPRDAARQRSSFIDKHLIQARTLMLTGPVTDRMAQHCASRLLIMESLDPERPITVFINSPGGSADSGFAIYDSLRFVNPPIRTVVNGLCASAAILILLAADKPHRFTLPESRLLLHQPSTTGHGSAADLDITAREILKMRQRYNNIVAAATGQSVDKVLEDTRRDFWLNSKESVEYGLVGRIVTRRREIGDDR